MRMRSAKKDFAFLNGILHRWAKGKQDNRSAWAQAMASVVTLGTGRGGVLFNTFPQEFCDSLASNTGGSRSGFACRGWKKDTSWSRTGRCSVSIHSDTTMDPTGEHRALIAEYTGKPELDFSESVLHQ